VGPFEIFLALKARNDVERSTITVVFFGDRVSRLQRFHDLFIATWGVAPGYYISRLWR
jgi:hypothetical protein